MWKIGPECAAQQAKCASASVMNCGVRNACAAVHSVSGTSALFADVPAAARIGGLLDLPRAQGELEVERALGEHMA